MSARLRDVSIQHGADMLRDVSIQHGAGMLRDVSIQHGAGMLTEYRFNTESARHYFCSVCGIYTHHQRRSNPQQYGVNVACLDGLSPFDLARVVVYDGINHSRDRGAGPLIPGHLTFSPTGAK